MSVRASISSAISMMHNVYIVDGGGNQTLANFKEGDPEKSKKWHGILSKSPLPYKDFEKVKDSKGNVYYKPVGALADFEIRREMNTMDHRKLTDLFQNHQRQFIKIANEKYNPCSNFNNGKVFDRTNYHTIGSLREIFKILSTYEIENEADIKSSIRSDIPQDITNLIYEFTKESYSEKYEKLMSFKISNR